MRALKTITMKLVFWLFILAISLTACSESIETPLAEVETSSPSVPTLTPTYEEPTATALPAAAVVNGERIPLAWFEREAERYFVAQETLGNDDVDESVAREMVLNDLIDQVLLAQAAREAGINFSDEDVQLRIDQLAAEMDLASWMSEWSYTAEELVESMRLQMLVAHQRDLIAGSIPDPVEQVELRQVFAFTEAGANRALLNLNSGAAFEDVALEFAPDTGGYLGWVPRGYLLLPEVEEAVFNKPVGSYTQIIQSDVGYHIVLVIDREVRPLTSDARLALARLALYSWLEDRRGDSTIEVLVD